MALLNVLTRPDAIQSVVFTPLEDVEKNQPYYAVGLHGFVMEDAGSGDEVVLDVSARTWQVNVGNLSVSKGDKIYIDTATNELTTDSNDRWFGTVVSDKDDNDIVEILVAPQS